MDNNTANLSDTFLALSDPTRRAVLRRLGNGPASVSDLARPFDIALPSFMKHIRLLERTGLIRSTKSGRVRTCTLQPRRLTEAEGWMAEQRAVWEARTDRLEAFVLQSLSEETPP